MLPLSPGHETGQQTRPSSWPSPAQACQALAHSSCEACCISLSPLLAKPRLLCRRTCSANPTNVHGLLPHEARQLVLPLARPCTCIALLMHGCLLCGPYKRASYHIVAPMFVSSSLSQLCTDTAPARTHPSLALLSGQSHPCDDYMCHGHLPSTSCFSKLASCHTTSSATIPRPFSACRHAMSNLSLPPAN